MNNAEQVAFVRRVELHLSGKSDPSLVGSDDLCRRLMLARDRMVTAQRVSEQEAVVAEAVGDLLASRMAAADAKLAAAAEEAKAKAKEAEEAAKLAVAAAQAAADAASALLPAEEKTVTREG